MTAIVETNDLTKFYGQTRGVENLNLAIQPGQVFGFLGPNGAGKSTTFRLLMDFIRPTSGSARVFGLDAQEDSREIRSRTGFMPGDLALYPRMTGNQIVEFFSFMRKIDVRQEAKRLAERLDLDLGITVRNYSTGNRQKLGLVQAFMHRPELLMLDEPTGGLDPIIQQEFYAMVADAVSDGATVFLSSHVLPEVERIADQVAIIRDGGLVRVDEVGAFRREATRVLAFTFSQPVPEAEFSTLDGVSVVTTQGTKLIITSTGPIDAIVKAAARHEVVELEAHEGELEDVFLAFYEDEP
ncbi:MAG: ABC transporter ATP-binding protein [Acidimicrobiia bacterium]|nr:ABC transporter ATP-binding protein [Acidimicrobiia bacterium]